MAETHTITETHHPTHNARITLDIDGRIIHWNGSAERIFGYSSKEVIGKSILILFEKEFAEKEKKILRKLKDGQMEHYQTECVTKAGNKVFIEFAVFPVKDDSGKVVSISKIGDDITEQREAEEKQARLAAIVDSSDDAIISKTLDGIITTWNHAATKMFGWTAEEAIGKHISLIIPAERLAEETKIIESIRRGEKIDHFETVRVAKDGSKRNLSITVSPIKDASGKIIGASKIARDISVRAEAEEQRRIYTERLQELSKYKDEFMVMASHELRTPLTVILANLQMLESIMEEDPRLKFIEKTIKQANKLASLITNLLDVSKIQAGKLRLNPTVFEMNGLLLEITSNLQQTTKNHQIIFEVEEGNLWVNADRERMEQVIINILSNAIKYSSDHSDITIRACKKDGQILVSVHDTGIGIPQKDIENVFLRFYRVSGSASSFSGSGVGLYISSEIVKSHGGNIWAKSKIGKGSDFYFSIPAVENKTGE
ncbi:MAG: PAS domain S-box protein [Ginsengibacter sp.]